MRLVMVIRVGDRLSRHRKLSTDGCKRNRTDEVRVIYNQTLNAASPASDRVISKPPRARRRKRPTATPLGPPAGPKFLRDETRRYQARRQPLISFGEFLAQLRRRKHDHGNELLAWLRRRPHARRRSPWSAKFNRRGLDYPESTERRRRGCSLLLLFHWFIRARVGAPRR
jgi:hypothetical protein